MARLSTFVFCFILLSLSNILTKKTSNQSSISSLTHTDKTESTKKEASTIKAHSHSSAYTRAYSKASATVKSFAKVRVNSGKSSKARKGYSKILTNKDDNKSFSTNTPKGEGSPKNNEVPEELPVIENPEAIDFIILSLRFFKEDEEGFDHLSYRFFLKESTKGKIDYKELATALQRICEEVNIPKPNCSLKKTEDLAEKAFQGAKGMTIEGKKVDDSGKLNEKQFYNLLESATAQLEGMLTSISGNAKLKNLFNIDYIISTVEKFQEDSDESLLEDLWKNSNINNDAYISLEEGETAVDSLLENIFASDPVVSESESVNPKKIAVAVFGVLDKDSDSKLNKEEFKKLTVEVVKRVVAKLEDMKKDVIAKYKASKSEEKESKKEETSFIKANAKAQGKIRGKKTFSKVKQ